MKKSTILFILFLLSNLLYSQQGRFSFGVTSSFGLHGVEPPFQWENKKESQSRIDIGIRRPKINFSTTFLLRYALYKDRKVNLNLTLECGYDFSTMRKEWHFRNGYDNEFDQYSNEVRIIHELKAHHIIVPAKINVEFKQIIFSMGLIGTRVLSASVDRTKKRREDIPLGLWSDEEITWKSNKVGSENREYNAPYLTTYTGLRGTAGIGYYLSENLIIGADLSNNLGSGFIRVYVNSDSPSRFYYASNTATIRLIMIL